jgi:hypothetical protein
MMQLLVIAIELLMMSHAMFYVAVSSSYSEVVEVCLCGHFVVAGR